MDGSAVGRGCCGWRQGMVLARRRPMLLRPMRPKSEELLLRGLGGRNS
jgi:hypothetical protein